MSTILRKEIWSTASNPVPLSRIYPRIGFAPSAGRKKSISGNAEAGKNGFWWIAGKYMMINIQTKGGKR